MELDRRSSPKIISKREKCSLCGLEAGRSLTQLIIEGEVHIFCCSGCRYVFEVLAHSPNGPPVDFKESQLYRTCVASGLIPQSQRDVDLEAGMDEDCYSPTRPIDNIDEDLTQEMTIKVEGMWCAACSWLIGEVLCKSKGIVDAELHFLSDLAKIKYIPHLIHPKEVINLITTLGYQASFPDGHKDDKHQRNGHLLRLGVSAIFTANVMMLSFAVDYGLFQELGKEGAYLAYPLALLATPVVFYGGHPILKRAWSGLRYRATSMETLIAVGALSAYLYSLIMTALGNLHLYFDTATMLITLVLLGKHIEAQAREKVSRGINELLQLAAGKVRLRLNGSERWVSPEAVLTGNEFIVAAGERTSIDGIVVSGSADVDESVLTGESRPVRKSNGDDVLGGTLILEGKLILGATRSSSEGSLGRMIAVMQEVIGKKDRREILADSITRRLVPAVLLMAAATAFYLTFQGSPTYEALLRALTVLVITCPCALGIATPLAKVAAIGLGRSHGILVRCHSALEKAKNADTWVFDKTGTLTKGDYSLIEIATTGVSPREALPKVAAVEAKSDHFIAREILRTLEIEPNCFRMRKVIPAADPSCPSNTKTGPKGLFCWERVEGGCWKADDQTRNGLRQNQGAYEPPEAAHIEFFEGMGVQGNFEDTKIVVGNRDFMHMQHLSVPHCMELYAGSGESYGRTVVFFGWDEKVHGLLLFGDSLRKGAKETLSQLMSRGCTIHLVSGDSEKTAGAIAGELCIQNFHGGILPEGKAEMVARLQKKGHCVAMVGDGINDAAAMAQADVSFALGARVNIVQKASDVTLLSSDPVKILEAIKLSSITSGITRQNLFLAFVYNALGIPLAILGLLNPIIAVFAMFLSSLTVIGNTLRIYRKKLVPGA